MTYTREAALQGTNQLIVASLSFPTQVGGVLYTYNRIANYSIKNVHGKGSVVIDLTQHSDDETLDIHLEPYLANNPINTVEVKYVDGITEQYSISALTSLKLGFIAYGGIVNNKRAVHYGLGVYTGETGDRSYSPDTLSAVPIQITGVDPENAVTFPSTLLDTSLVTPTADLTLATGRNSIVTYLAIA